MHIIFNNSAKDYKSLIPYFSSNANLVLLNNFIQEMTMSKNKILCASLLFSLSASAYAAIAPNVWVSGLAQGFTEYSIRDKNGYAIWISCNEAAGPEYDNSVSFEYKDNYIRNENKQTPLHFVLDGKNSITPPSHSKWHNGINAWSVFAQKISKAKTIDVFVDNKKITSYIPTKASIKRIANDIASCEPVS